MQTHPISAGHDDESANTHAVNEIADCAREAEDAMRRLSRLTNGRPSMTPADLDTVLAHLAETIAAVPQVATQLGGILDRSRDTHLLAMDGMTATTDPDLAVDTARLHLHAVRDPAIATHRHINSARNEAAHISASPRLGAADDGDTDEIPAPGGAGSRRREDREPPRPQGPNRQGPAR